MPSVYVGFYSFTSDSASKTLSDNEIKADISNLKSALAHSGYKTRFAVILLGGDEEGQGPLTLSEGIQERLENIRRGTALDPKSVFYIPPQESPSELKRVIDNILSVLYTTSVEYYRDLGRHSRKKRSRGFAPQPTVPPTSGTSQTLSLSDWNFRYDFKSAVFAEFRHEIDAAIRFFEQAYEVLLGQDVLDIIPSWSPRWNEARLLSDIIAIRCLRCHIWMGQTTLAVRRWQAHRDRIGDFVDRRGRGTNNYGWEAWEARWAMVMANMIEKMEIPSLSSSSTTLFLMPEKAVLGDRLQPWEFLHHTGYWYRIAARHLGARRTLARAIPEEDRTPPDNTPASNFAKQAYNYDTYMCPDPYKEFPLAGEGTNHSRLIIDCLQMATLHYQARGQVRTVAELSIACAREMIHLESWQEVLGILRPFWDDKTFRNEGWLDISEDLCWLMRRAGVGAGNGGLVVAADWELIDKSKIPANSSTGSCANLSTEYYRRPQWNYDISKSLQGVSTTSKPYIELSDETACSFITTSLAFRSKEGKAGEPCSAQLSLTSHALADSAPVTFESLKVQFTGNLKSIFIEHNEPSKDAESSMKQSIYISAVDLKEEILEDEEEDRSALLMGQAELTIAPGQTRVFELKIPLREPGEVIASSVVLSIGNEAFDLDFTLNFQEHDQVTGWYVEGSHRPRHARPDAHVLQIQPRPPKMEIRLVDPPAQFFANEVIELIVELLNNEEESANVKLDAHLLGKETPIFRLQAEGHDEKIAEVADEEVKIMGLALGSIKNSSSSQLVLHLDPTTTPSTLDLQIRASYHLASDAATTVVQMLSYQLNIANAFEANYELVPRVHSDPWPSLFDYEGVGEASDGDVPARGLAQKWSLLCNYMSFAQHDLNVVGMELTVLSAVGGGRCSVVRSSSIPHEGLVTVPNAFYDAQFDIVVQKPSIDDRNPLTVELAYSIKWQRPGNPENPINTTTMPPGKYLTLSPEPRVLASVYHSPPDETSLLQLDITIENPSIHFLTFGLSMEPSDEFAFSGGKTTTLNLLPMSRRMTTYRLLPLVRGTYIRPGLVVRDKYFQKVLRIIPTEGMKIDKDGLLVWVPGEKKADGDVAEE